jgi:TIR domain
MAIIFVSYRRHDAPGHAGKLFDHLNTVYPAGQVFLDTNDLRAGENWPQRLKTVLENSLVVLCIIGRSWDVSRLRADSDIVRRELSIALSLGRPVVPLLFDGASLPGFRDLPEDCRGILDYHAMTFDSWDREVFGLKLERLPQAINQLISNLFAAGNPAATSRIFLDLPIKSRDEMFYIYFDGATKGIWATKEPAKTHVGWHDIKITHRYYQVERTGAGSWEEAVLATHRIFLEAGDYSIKIRKQSFLHFFQWHLADQPLRR